MIDKAIGWSVEAEHRFHLVNVRVVQRGTPFRRWAD